MAKLVFSRNGVSVFAPSEAHVLADSSHAKPHIQIKGVEFKHCPRCNTWKKLVRFHVQVKAWDGLQDMCVSCRAGANLDQQRAVRLKAGRKLRVVGPALKPREKVKSLFLGFWHGKVGSH